MNSTFFLTIADSRTCTGESGTYLFHNYDHHSGMGMTLEEVVTTLNRFEMEIPPDLLERLTEDAKRAGVETTVSVTTVSALSPGKYLAGKNRSVVDWQTVL